MVPYTGVVCGAVNFLVGFMVFFVLILVCVFANSGIRPGLYTLLVPLVLLSSTLLNANYKLVISSMAAGCHSLNILISFKMAL